MFDKKKIKKELLEIELYKKEFEEKNLYSFMHNKEMDDTIYRLAEDKKDGFKKIEYLFEMASGWDKTVEVDYKVGKTLDNLANNPEYEVLIHRANLFLDDNNLSPDLINIMENGLRNQGHINATGGGGVNIGAPSLGLTTTPLKGTSGYINLISNWHGNDSIIVLAIPKDLLNKEGDFYNPDDIYNKDGNDYYIKPEFIIGNVVKKNNKLQVAESKEEILERANNKTL